MPEMLSESNASILTAPHHRLWLDAHRYAENEWWGVFRKKAPRTFAELSSLTRANFIHDKVRAYIIGLGIGLSVSDSMGFFAQIVSDTTGSALVRFKLLDNQLQPSYHASEQQDRMDRHEFTHEQLSLMGIPAPPTPLTCGYQVAKDESSIQRVVVVCHYNREYQYDYDLSTGTSTEVLSLPTLGQPERSRVLSRRSKDESVAPSE
jgi:hypothetical protein